MALERKPIAPDALSAAARKVLGGPGPMKMMAARGLAPLPNPADLVTVLYQLSLDADGKVAQAAKKSAAELPDKVLGGALADQQLQPVVLDLFAALVARRPALIEVVLTNPATADATIAELAAKLGEREVDIIASNEQRLLRHPAIIGAMYMNRHARMSTVDRAVELAVRNEIKVPGIPAWEEVARAVLGTSTEESTRSADVDALFAAAAAGDTDGEEGADLRDLPISQMSIPAKIRLATLGNAFTRSVLIRDSNKMVSMAAIKAPGVTEMEAIKFAGNSALNEEIISYIARQREWTKLYGCKLALANNPKTPMPVAIRLVPHLREKDVRTLARSKSVPSAVTAAARKMVMARTGGGAGKGRK